MGGLGHHDFSALADDRRKLRNRTLIGREEDEKEEESGECNDYWKQRSVWK